MADLVHIEKPNDNRLGMILKGFPRISESFISTEILLLESLGIPIEIYSLKQPRENFSHAKINRIKAPVTYMPEYVLPHWRTLLRSNSTAWRKLRAQYRKGLWDALLRAFERRSWATLRHFLQAGHLTAIRLTERPVDHLHAHFCHTPTSVALFASNLTGIPFSFTAHAKDIYTSEPDQLTRKIEKARFVVTCTKYNARHLSKLSSMESRTRHSKTPIYTIYHGIDLDFFSFQHAPAPGPPYRILSIGRHVEKKGYEDLLKAVKLLADAGVDFQLVQIGSGEITPQLIDLVHDLGIGGRVQLLGTLPHEEVIKHYRSAHCFALACKIAVDGDRDGIPNVLVEAMAVGLPVVATRVSAIPELVEDGVTGTLVEPENPAAMADAILRVLLHPGWFEKQKQKA
ncbi:MAG: glycosyltransferase, partial [Desulforhabdus sp.]|nr:glycosyltransferase [Desulforhabdus sp.]